MPERRTIVFLGCGNMGAAIVAGVATTMRDADLVAIDPDRERARSLLPPGAAVELLGAPEDIGARPVDLVILGVKPQVFARLDRTTLDWLGRHFVVSIMAGIPLARLQESTGGRRLVRVMPNLPAFVGEGMTLGCVASDAVAPADRALVAGVFESVGRFAWAENEAALEAASPVFGCGPGFLFAVAEQMTRAAVDSGVPADLADTLVRQTFLGSARMLATDPRDAVALKRAVTSPGGTTEAGLAPLEAPEALPRIFPEVFAAARARARELASEGR